MCERPPKHFHPLLQKEKELQETLHRILPEGITNSLSPKSSRLAYFMAYLKPATHLVILYTDRHGRRIKSPISGMSDIGDQIRRNSPSLFVPAIFSPSTASRQ